MGTFAIILFEMGALVCENGAQTHTNTNISSRLNVVCLGCVCLYTHFKAPANVPHCQARQIIIARRAARMARCRRCRVICERRTIIPGALDDTLCAPCFVCARDRISYPAHTHTLTNTHEIRASVRNVRKKEKSHVYLSSGCVCL